MSQQPIRQGSILTGPLFSEPVEVLVLTDVGGSVKLVGRGLRTGQVIDSILSRDQLSTLQATPTAEPFDGDAGLFRLGVEAHRLGLAYEYDPFFSLSIARVDPLPHQLEAVYDYFLRAPRIRFLLADDPGAGKTIMAGLLLKELKARGLVQRTLVIAPANLTFQWQRELRDKFREDFTVVRGESLRSQYGKNPWQEQDQLITSVSWVSRVEDARDSLLRSTWDLIIVDEAHKMSASSDDHKTLAYKLGEELSDRTDHLLLMTATPHKGDARHFCLFLALLDRDVYGDVSSLQDATSRGSAPFYLRRRKEDLVTFPDPETGECHKLFTERQVDTVAFDLDGPEREFYDDLTRFVEDQSVAVAGNESPAARAVGFIMAMLQRRMASSIYAVRRSLERMRARREEILSDPEAWRRKQIQKRLPDDFDDLTEEEQQDLIVELEDAVVSYDPVVLRDEIARLTALVAKARQLEGREVESKLVKLREVLTQHGIFADQRMKLLVFTEHKDTLDYLVGDGRDGRPLGKLREWGLAVAQIHGGMKIGSRDEPHTRIWAEREFRENAQVLVATEAAGEGINLQFCWFMINYDIPWNPVRLEQRMGRIHRYGQERDCVILNFAAVNTTEGRVLAKLLDRLRQIREDLGTDQVFDVVGDIFPANRLERLFRELYARQTTEIDITNRIVAEVDPQRFREITESTLEGLARRELNLQSLIGRSIEARERRLVPEVIEDFFVRGAPEAGIAPRPVAAGGHVFRIGKVPRSLWSVGERLESRFGRLGREYARVVFDKELLNQDATLEWVTPGHPLFEVVREEVGQRAAEHLRHGAVFFDLQRSQPGCLDLLAASVKDGRGRTLHRRLFVVETAPGGEMRLREPTVFLELVPAPQGFAVPAGVVVPDGASVERFLLETALQGFLTEVSAERVHEIEVVASHVETSLNALIHRRNLELADLTDQRDRGVNPQGLEGRLAQAEQRIDELNHRLDTRRNELAQERNLTIGDVQRLGRALVLPHPERTAPDIAPMVRDDDIERIAVQEAMRHEEARGWVVESVEEQNRGFDLISRRLHPEDPQTAIEVRFIEVKGRAGVGAVALSANEYRTAQRLGRDYWLYVVFNCAAQLELHTVQDPAGLGWQPVVKVEQYVVGAEVIRDGSTG